MRLARTEVFPCNDSVHVVPVDLWLKLRQPNDGGPKQELYISHALLQETKGSECFGADSIFLLYFKMRKQH